MKWNLGIALLIFLSACQAQTQSDDWKTKVKFNLELMSENATERSLLGYGFCIPNQPVLVEQLRQIHTDLEVVDHPEKTCDSTHYYCQFHPVQPAHIAHLEKIAKLSYVKEIHPVWRENP
ncbi:MAG: hypothetical protein MRZ79_11285 [Bacteroidia bacterium]|nr:hypothetical protein [Bacteroidia bacterium]